MNKMFFLHIKCIKWVGLTHESVLAVIQNFFSLCWQNKWQHHYMQDNIKSFDSCHQGLLNNNSVEAKNQGEGQKFVFWDENRTEITDSTGSTGGIVSTSMSLCCWRLAKMTFKNVYKLLPSQRFHSASSMSSSSLSCIGSSSPAQFSNSPVSEFHIHLICTLNSAISMPKSFYRQRKKKSQIEQSVKCYPACYVTVKMFCSPTVKNSPEYEPAQEWACLRPYRLHGPSAVSPLLS